LLSVIKATKEVNMFGFGKSGDLFRAEKNLEREFGLTLNKIPYKEPVIELFSSMSKQNNLSHEAQTALLYRLVVMNYLGAVDILRDNGEDTQAEDLVWLTDILNRSVDWSEKAKYHVALEQMSSPLNMNIETLLQSFGISRA
jgi:hypothetical protein